MSNTPGNVGSRKRVGIGVKRGGKEGERGQSKKKEKGKERVGGVQDKERKG